ncbi:MAG TPA: hypothetical protein VGM90_18010 [Kofleriaceae bacterium]
MDWTVVVELVKALAWPVVVVFLGLTAKPLIKGIADRVKVIKAGGNEIQLDDVPKPKQLEAPKEEVKLLAAPKEPQLELPPAPVAEPDLVSYAPAGAVINAWSRVEDVLRREAIRLGLLTPNEASMSVAPLVARFKAANLINVDTEIAVLQLRLLRNQVAHSQAKVSQAAAEQFVDTAEYAIKAIEAYADINQLRRIFGKLGVDDTDPEQVKKILVGRLSNFGIKPADERTRALWGAKLSDVLAVVTERDAALLLARGAELGGDPAADWPQK